MPPQNKTISWDELNSIPTISQEEWDAVPIEQSQPPHLQSGFFEELTGGPGTYLEKAGQVASDIGTGFINAGKGAYGLAKEMMPRNAQDVREALTHPSRYVGTTLGKTLYKDTTDTPVDMIDRTGQLAAGSIGLGTAYQAGKDAFLPPGVAGADPNRTPGDYGKMQREELANMSPAIALPAARAVQGAGQAIRDTVFGMPKQALLERQAQNADIYGNVLNLGSKRTLEEDALINSASKYSDDFTRINPVKGLDPSNGRAAIEGLKSNLENTKISGIKTRESILSDVAQKEASIIESASQTGEPSSLGIAFDDIPETIQTPNGLNYGLNTIQNTISGGEVGVPMARAYVRKQFGISEDGLHDLHGRPLNPSPDDVFGRMPIPPKRLTAVEANTARMRIDNQIREWGGWDTQTLNSLKPELSPSTRDAYVEALKFYRSQLDSSLKNHIGELVGQEAADAFHLAGRDIAAASTYKPLVDRFQRETGQAFAPGSAKAVPPGAGVLGTSGVTGKIIREISPSTANAKMQTQALSREGNAIRDLQTLVDIKSNVGFEPAPRGWAKIKTSAQHLDNIGTLAIQLGLVSSIGQLTQMPDEQAKQIVGMVAQAAPEVFEQTPDKVNVMDQKFINPMDKDFMVAQTLDKSASERAKIIGAAFQDRYVPSSAVSAPVGAIKPPALPVTMDKINRTLQEAMTGSETLSYPGLDLSYNKAQSSLMEQLNKMTAIHANDLQ